MRMYLVWHKMMHEDSVLLAICETMNDAKQFVYCDLNERVILSEAIHRGETISWQIEEGYPEYITIEPKEVWKLSESIVDTEGLLHV